MDQSGDSHIGCLGRILQLLGFTPTTSAHESPEALPYRHRDDFLSPAERSLYGVLVTTLGNEFVVCPKVNVADILYVTGSAEAQKYRNKIDRKHVDFLVCDLSTMAPRFAVELDDSSHARAERKDRDEFLDAAFKAANFPLLRVPAKQSYRTVELKATIVHILEPATSLPVPVPQPDPIPLCPKCGIPMVKRVAKQGDQAGQAFWGCSNYPKCRQTASVIHAD